MPEPVVTLPHLEPATVAFPALRDDVDQPPLVGPTWHPPAAVLATDERRVGRLLPLVAGLALLLLLALLVVPLFTVG
ncbi:hypothetical protein [Pseudonocardia pini]|uniref:hypothetical protein n=1 Tax=Pseudonocardia pini TaxID=2758030 RepID=UPI0015EFE52A|nr:hypothetical protein [Pseudonocardia pini]